MYYRGHRSLGALLVMVANTIREEELTFHSQDVIFRQFMLCDVEIHGYLIYMSMTPRYLMMDRAIYRECI
jgi:hypothetical protein